MYSFFRELLLATPLSSKIQAMKTLLESYPVTSGQKQIQYDVSCNRNIDYLKNPQTNKPKNPASLSILCHIVLSVFKCDSHKCKGNIEQPMIN